MFGERRCLSCGEKFKPRPQNPGQQYCSEKACQRERRRRWQSAKQRTDADYRDNQRRAQQAWAAQHGPYWRAWRDRHPEYCERNRAQQQLRNQRRRAGLIAKMDASGVNLSVPSGVYRLVPAAGGEIAKMDAWTVRIAVIAGPYADGTGAGGGLQREDVMGRGGAVG
jgi:hypothetical protein